MSARDVIDTETTSRKPTPNRPYKPLCRRTNMVREAVCNTRSGDNSHGRKPEHSGVRAPMPAIPTRISRQLCGVWPSTMACLLSPTTDCGRINSSLRRARVSIQFPGQSMCSRRNPTIFRALNVQERPNECGAIHRELP